MIFEKFVKIFQYIFKNELLVFEYSASKEKLDDFFDLITKNLYSLELIRVGGKNDGGYLIPNDFNGVDFCFSPGVDYYAYFEEDLINRGVKCFLADYNVSSPPIKSEFIKFVQKHLGIIDDYKNITLDTWINETLFKGHGMGILQMDIEGSEYEVINSITLSNLLKFKYLVIEFHDLDQLRNNFGYQIIYSTFNKLLKYYNIVHIHPNNIGHPITIHNYEIPPLLEITFALKNISDYNDTMKIFPHTLDSKNVQTKPDIILPLCWYNKK